MRLAAAVQQMQAEEQDSGDGPFCWICLAGEDAGPLVLPCKCPALFSHRGCLARWQLQRVGRQEERSCRFCRSALPPWPQALLCSDLEQADIHHSNPRSELACAITTIDVLFEDQMVSIPCFPGERGAELFQRQVRHVFNLHASAKLDVTFELEAPALADSLGDTVWLNGFEYFDVAFQMASAAAAMRGPSQKSTGRAPRASHPSHTSHSIHTSHTSPAPTAQRQQDVLGVRTPTPYTLRPRAHRGVAPGSGTRHTSGGSRQGQGSVTPSPTSVPAARGPGSFSSVAAQLCHSISDLSPASLQAARWALGDGAGDHAGMPLSASGVPPSQPAEEAPAQRREQGVWGLPAPPAPPAQVAVPAAFAIVPSSPDTTPAASGAGGGAEAGARTAKVKGGADAMVAAVWGRWTWRLGPQHTVSVPLLKKLSKAVHRSWAAVGDWF